MTPLSELLSSGRGKAPSLSGIPAVMASAFADGSPQECNPLESQALADAAYERGRADALADAAAATEAALAQQRQLADSREQEYIREWSARCSSGVGASVAEAFADVRRCLETALTDALSPFLEEMVHATALQQVFHLLAGELTDTEDAILEIRAPATMHGHLSGFLEKRGLGAVLTESDRIEVVSRAGTAKFETMAARWIDLLREGEP